MKGHTVNKAHTYLYRDISFSIVYVIEVVERVSKSDIYIYCWHGCVPWITCEVAGRRVFARQV